MSDKAHIFPPALSTYLLLADQSPPPIYPNHTQVFQACVENSQIQNITKHFLINIIFQIISIPMKYYEENLNLEGSDLRSDRNE